MRQSTGASRVRDLSVAPNEHALQDTRKNRSVNMLADIEKELEEVHQQIDRIEEMIRKVFNDETAEDV